MAGLVPFNRENPAVLSTGFDGFYNMLDDFFSEGLIPQRSLFRDTFKIDVEETPEEFRIQAEVPGIKRDEIDLSLNDGRLLIAVKREENTEDKDKHYIHRERRLASVTRSVYLADASSEGIQAKLADGILSITVAKKDKTENVIAIEIE